MSDCVHKSLLVPLTESSFNCSSYLHGSFNDEYSILMMSLDQRVDRIDEDNSRNSSENSQISNAASLIRTV